MPSGSHGQFPPSVPEGSPGVAPHCSADTACPEPGLTASHRAQRGAGRGAWHRGPSLRLLEVRASQRFRVPRESATGVSFKHFILFHQKTPLGAQSQAQMERTVTRAWRAPREGASGRGAARACTGAGTAPCGEGSEPPWQGSSWSKPSLDRRAGPRRSRQVPAQPGTPRHTPGHPAAVQQHASPGAAGSRATSYCSGHPPAASAKRQVFAWPVTQP